MSTTTERSPRRTAGVEIPACSTDLLMHLIVFFLAPMFYPVSGGDVSLARRAAVETVNAYRAANQADLLSAAQIVACGLAALGSLGLSMAEDISLSMTLRLHGNANALTRSAELNRRAIKQGGSAAAPSDQFSAADHDAFHFQAAMFDNSEETPRQDAQTESVPEAAPAAEPISVPVMPATCADPSTSDQERQALWASALHRVAGEFTADALNLPPEQRKLASFRAMALSSTANSLLAGSAPPQGAIANLGKVAAPKPP